MHAILLRNILTYIEYHTARVLSISHAPAVKKTLRDNNKTPFRNISYTEKYATERVIDLNGQMIRTFLSANSANGFFSYFDEFLKDRIAYIIKGGPGTGKSSFMKKIGAAALRKGDFAEYVFCSSDPDSLDALYIHETETVFADGTPPHIMEPPYPGAMGGVINIGEMWDEHALRESRDDIAALNTAISGKFMRAYRYIRAAGCAASDITDCAMRHIERRKLSVFADSTAERLFPEQTEGKAEGRLFRRFISGITPKGYITFRDTVYTLCSKVTSVRDPWGISYLFLERLKSEALRKGYDVYAFYSPLNPEKLCHVAFPDMDAAFVTSDRLCTFGGQNARSINMSRFLDGDAGEEKEPLIFAYRLLKLCIEEAVYFLRKAKELHDDLEDIYIASMDFDAVTALAEKFAEENT